ncbi:MAG: TM2 domain-containing membrane protein YozV [Cognaticolwellia sp.]|jgi:TM2 domain-containing membrane protein YozV
MSNPNPYSSPEARGAGPRGDLIHKPQLSGFAITAAVFLNLFFMGAPGYFIVGQYAKGCVMGLVTLFSWVVGLGFIPTLVSMFDVVYLGQRLKRGEGIEAWEFFDNKSAPESAPITDRDPTLIYKENINGASLAFAILGNLLVLGGAGYFVTGQNTKGIVTMLSTLVLMALGIGIVIPFITAADAAALILRQRRGEGIGQWQFF